MRGWNLRILAKLLYWAADSGYSASLTSNTRPMIAQPQLPNRPYRWLSTQNRPSPRRASSENWL